MKVVGASFDYLKVGSFFGSMKNHQFSSEALPSGFISTILARHRPWSFKVFLSYFEKHRSIDVNFNSLGSAFSKHELECLWCQYVHNETQIAGQWSAKSGSS